MAKDIILFAVLVGALALAFRLAVYAHEARCTAARCDWAWCAHYDGSNAAYDFNF